MGSLVHAGVVPGTTTQGRLSRMAHIPDVESPTVVGAARHGLADLVHQIRPCTRGGFGPSHDREAGGRSTRQRGATYRTAHRAGTSRQRRPLHPAHPARRGGILDLGRRLATGADTGNPRPHCVVFVDGDAGLRVGNAVRFRWRSTGRGWPMPAHNRLGQWCRSARRHPSSCEHRRFRRYHAPRVWGRPEAKARACVAPTSRQPTDTLDCEVCGTSVGPDDNAAGRRLGAGGR